MVQYRLPAGMEDAGEGEGDVDSDDDDSVVAGVVMVVVDASAAKAGAEKAEVLQHANKSCKARSAVLHAGAIPDQNSLLAPCRREEFSSGNGLFASSLVDDSMGR
jgi:hypothetical protein